MFVTMLNSTSPKNTHVYYLSPYHLPIPDSHASVFKAVIPKDKHPLCAAAALLVCEHKSSLRNMAIC